MYMIFIIDYIHH